MNPIEFIKSELVLPNDQRFGDVITPWQEQFFEAIFATVEDKTRFTRKPINRPRFRLCYSERRRGESKTEDCAAAALADLVTGPDWSRSYAVACDTDQAGLILDSIQGFKARSPILAGLELQKNVVRNPRTNSELRVMSSDDRTAYGVRPRKVFFDELSLQPDDRLWNAMWSAIGKNPQSQMVAVSMAGWDFSSIGWKVRELAHRNDDYFFGSREGSEIAPWLSERDMEEQRATLHPADFARFWDCKWTEPLGAWITREMFDGCVTGKEQRSGDGCVGFVDIGIKHDPTAIAVCHKHGDSVILDTLRTMQGSATDSVQLEAIEDEVVHLTKQFGVKHWMFESWQAVASTQRLQNRLRGVSVELRHPTADSVGRLFGNLYALFRDRKLVLYPHEQLRREALALVTKTVGGRLKPVESSSVHQDHVVALGGAAEMLIEDDFGPIVLSYRDYNDEPDLPEPVRPVVPFGGGGPSYHDFFGDDD